MEWVELSQQCSNDRLGTDTCMGRWYQQGSNIPESRLNSYGEVGDFHRIHQGKLSMSRLWMSCYLHL